MEGLAAEDLNSYGFSALPSELYSEILGYFPTVPIPQFAYREETGDPQRHVSLLALSQTCRSLRSFFLRYAWKRIEVYEGMGTPSGTLTTEDEQRGRAGHMKDLLDTKFAEEVLRQLETVTRRNPDLRKYVHVVNITFINLSHKLNILPQLAQTLSILPHVHTLQLRCPEHDLTTIDFSPYSYPQIQTVSVTRGPGFIFQDILSACPNATSYIEHSGIMFLDPLLITCSSRTQLEALGVIRTVYSLPLEELASTFPHLRELSLDSLTLHINEKCLGNLSLLPLHTIRLCLTVVDDPDPFSHATHADRERWIELAKEILKKCPTHGSDVVQKRVVVVENGRSTKTHLVFA